MKNEAQTVDAKHVFIDIVDYTHNRSVEAQTDLISILNEIIKKAIEENNIKKEQRLFIPTGDGMCISLLNVNVPYDIHIQLALSILKKIHHHNELEKDEMRQFDIRIGINENTDNLIIDINDQKNISGSGINYASRIEGLCDKNQILVGIPVFHKLIQREKYMNSFIPYSAEVKHGVSLDVYQFKNKDLNYLNNETPSKFRSVPKKISRISSLQGYYLANCIKYEDFIIRNNGRGQEEYSLKVLMMQLAEDSLAKSKVTKTNPVSKVKVKRPLQKHFDFIQSVDFWIIVDLSDHFESVVLSKISNYLSESYLFVNDLGKKKLLENQSLICIEFNIK